MKIGITGASGFLGSNLLEHLSGRGHELLALTRTLPARETSTRGNITWLQGDLSSPHDAAAFVSDVETIVHLAWTNTPLTSNAHLASDAAVNMIPTLTLLEAVRARAARPHIVFASSGGAVYGSARSGRPFREVDACDPQSSYGIQKLTVEGYLRMGAEYGWLTATALRIGNPYGSRRPGACRDSSEPRSPSSGRALRCGSSATPGTSATTFTSPTCAVPSSMRSRCAGRSTC